MGYSMRQKMVHYTIYDNHPSYLKSYRFNGSMENF